ASCASTGSTRRQVGQSRFTKRTSPSGSGGASLRPAASGRGGAPTAGATSAPEPLARDASRERAVDLALVRLHERAHHLAEIAAGAGAGGGDRLVDPARGGGLVGEPRQEAADHLELGALGGGALGAARPLERLDALLALLLEPAQQRG